MILVGIDVAKDKHDCFICNSEGEALCKTFSFPNSMEGFNDLYVKIKSFSEDLSKLKVGLEATGHYSYNLLGFLLNKGLPTFVINPLHTNLYRKSLSLRKTKTDKGDAHTIAMMLIRHVVPVGAQPHPQAVFLAPVPVCTAEYMVFVQAGCALCDVTFFVTLQNSLSHLPITPSFSCPARYPARGTRSQSRRAGRSFPLCHMSSFQNTF